MTTMLIVNPQARGGWLRRNWPQLAPKLHDILGPFSVVFTKQAGDGRPLARQALKSGAKLIIAFGGDGTASEVATGLLEEKGQHDGAEAPFCFGYLPCGTGGDLRKTLGTPSTLLAAAKAIADSKGRFIDAGCLDYISNDGQPQRGYFLNVASVGIGGLVDLYANRSKKRLGGKLTFFLASLRATLNYRNAAVQIRMDDLPMRQERIYSIAISNGRYFGGGMHIAPRAAMDDGLLDVVTLGDLSFGEAVRLSQRIYKGEHLSLPKVSYLRGKSVTIEPCDAQEHVLLDVDGETPGRLPATFQIVPRALHFRG